MAASSTISQVGEILRSIAPAAITLTASAVLMFLWFGGYSYFSPRVFRGWTVSIFGALIVVIDTFFMLMPGKTIRLGFFGIMAGILLMMWYNKKGKVSV